MKTDIQRKKTRKNKTPQQADIQHSFHQSVVMHNKNTLGRLTISLFKIIVPLSVLSMYTQLLFSFYPNVSVLNDPCCYCCPCFQLCLFFLFLFCALILDLCNIVESNLKPESNTLYLYTYLMSAKKSNCSKQRGSSLVSNHGCQGLQHPEVGPQKWDQQHIAYFPYMKALNVKYLQWPYRIQVFI